MTGLCNRWQRNVRSAAAGVALVSAGTAITPAGAQSLSAIGSTFGVPERAVDVTVGGEAQYDSNIARASAAGAAARRLKKADVRFRPSVEGNIILPTGPAVLTLQGIVGYDFYARNSRLNRERIALNGGAGTKLSICDIGVQGGFARSQNDLADLSIVPGDVATSTVNVQTVSRIGGTATCGAAVGLRPTASIEYRHSTNSAELRRVSNYNALIYGGGLSYASQALGVVTAFVGRSEFDYPDRPTTGLFSGASQFDLTSAGLRLDRRLGARLQFNGQLSYVDVNGSGGRGGRFNGLNWDIALALRAGDRTQITVGTSRSVDASAGFNSRASRVSTYTAEATYALSPLMRVSLTGSRRKRDFDVNTVVSQAVLLTQDKIDEVAARLAYTAGRRVTFNLTAGYQNRDADLAFYRYHSYRGSIGARIKI